jgi:hypothetical protein
MSGKIRIFGLVCAVALTVLAAGIFFGQGAPGDPCGGHYAGEGLKAMFLTPYDAATCNEGNCNILNDIEGAYYKYQVPGGDCVFLFKAGHVIVGIGNSGRHVNINFDQIIAGPPECPSMPYSSCSTQEFQLRTDVGFTPSRGYDGDPNVLVLTSTNARLNFGGMTPGKTYYCQTSIKFRVAGDPAEYQHHFQAKVFYGYVGGVLKWVITPIDEPYWVYTVTRVGKKLIPVDPPTWHESSVYAEIGSATCAYGTYCLPFKLILERLP